MAATLSQLLSTVDSILGADTEQVASLAAAITSASATTFTVANSNYPLQAGQIVEVDNELMRVTGVARTAGSTDTATVVRGVNGSTAATHLINALVGVSPTYPRWRKIQALNLVFTDWVTNRAPMVTVDSSQTFSSTSDVLSVPATTLDVLSVEVREVASYTMFTRIPHGRPREYPTALVATGRGVPLATWGFPAGYTAYIRYTAPWGPELVADADTLPSSWLWGKDLLATGAAAHLLGGKFSRRGTYDQAVSQREEQRQSGALTAQSGQALMQKFAELLEQASQTWPGSKPPQYVEV
jgi:hypothetical protein